MDKRKKFYIFNDITTKMNMGAFWVGLIKSFLPIGQLVQEAAMWQVMAWGTHIAIPYYIIFVLVAIKSYMMMFVNYYGGVLAKKVGIWQYSNEFMAKEEHLSPFNVELRETMKNICKELKIKHKFKEL